ncbi:MAG: deoxyribodipyrimidine photo-lyase, partial [Gammaproteobacteria bacterium]
MKLVWFRNDLRCRDNPALFNACRRAGGRGVVAVVAFCAEQWSSHDESTARVEFWLASLRSLQAELAELNIPLRVIDAGTFDRVPQQLLSLARELQCDGLFLNREYCLNEVLRDKQVVEHFHEAGI